jgi:hypothetical protein
MKPYFLKELESGEEKKLFLCTRNIKVGDTVKVDVLGNGVLNDFKFTDIDLDEGYEVWNFHGVGYYYYYPGFDDEPPPFKVIGLISPEADWAKEDDEFDEEEEWRGPIINTENFKARYFIQLFKDGKFY